MAENTSYAYSMGLFSFEASNDCSNHPHINFSFSHVYYGILIFRRHRFLRFAARALRVILNSPL